MISRKQVRIDLGMRCYKLVAIETEDGQTRERVIATFPTLEGAEAMAEECEYVLIWTPPKGAHKLPQKR